jgi:hypothetical protein
MVLDIRPVNPRVMTQLAKTNVRRDQVMNVLNCPHFLERFPLITPAAMQVLNKHAPWLKRVDDRLAAAPLLDHGDLQIMRCLVRVVEFGVPGKTFYYGAHSYCGADRALFLQMQGDFTGSFEAIALETHCRYGIKLEADAPITKMAEEITVSLFLKHQIGWGETLRAAGFERIIIHRLGISPSIGREDGRKTLHLPIGFLAEQEYSEINTKLTRLLANQPN